MATYNASRPPTSIKTALNAPMETDGLIKPQKLKNPVVESAMHRAVTRELKINSKRGELIQNQKSELEKAWAKKGTEKTVSPNKELTELDKMLQRQKAKAEVNMIDEDDGKKREEKLPEFLTIKLRSSTAK